MTWSCLWHSAPPPCTTTTALHFTHFHIPILCVTESSSSVIKRKHFGEINLAPMYCMVMRSQFCKCAIQHIPKAVNSHHRNQSFGWVQEKKIGEGLTCLNKVPTLLLGQKRETASWLVLTPQSRVRVSQGPNNLFGTMHTESNLHGL